jgi:hypothetical protein
MKDTGLSIIKALTGHKQTINDATRSFVNAIAALKYEINKNINLSYTGNLQFTNRDSQSHINSYKMHFN